MVSVEDWQQILNTIDNALDMHMQAYHRKETEGMKTTIDTDYYFRLLEKEKKWDSFAGLKSYEKIIEKAENWDLIGGWFNIDKYKDLEEKAKERDEIVKYTPDIQQLREKSKKWDNYYNAPNIAETYEKAQKYDKIMKEFGVVEKWLNDTAKWANETLERLKEYKS